MDSVSRDDLLKAIHHQRWIDWMTIGTYYGFPTCCVIHFCNRCTSVFLGKTEEPVQRGFMNETGFVPCPTCYASKTKEVLEAEIAETRLCPTPFPDDSGTVHADMQALYDRCWDLFERHYRAQAVKEATA